MMSPSCVIRRCRWRGVRITGADSGRSRSRRRKKLDCCGNCIIGINDAASSGVRISLVRPAVSTSGSVFRSVAPPSAYFDCLVWFSPMAMACLRFLTVGPVFEPLWSCPRLNSPMTSCIPACFWALVLMGPSGISATF